MTKTNHHLTRAALVGLILLGSGCRDDDPRLQALDTEISRDSAIVLMGGGAPERPYRYLTGGHQIEALIFRREGAEGPADSLTRAQLTPVVLLDGKVSGWGWSYWDSVAGANRIRVEPER